MRTPIRYLLITIGILIALVAALAAWIALRFDANDHRERIAAEFMRHTGRSLQIDGTLNLSFYPWLGIEARDAVLADAPGFGDTPFARIARLQARARLLPLLRGELDIDRIAIDGLALKLVRAADGRTNWSTADADTAGSAPAAAPRGDTATTAGALALAIGGIDIQGASVSWTDLRDNTQLQLTKLQLQASEIRPGAPFPLQSSFTLGSSGMSATMDIAIDSRVRISPQDEVIELSDLSVRFGRSDGIRPQGQIEAALRADADSIVLERLRAIVDDTRIEGRVAVTEPTRPAIQFDLDIDNLDLDAYLPAGAQVAPAPAGAATAAARNPSALVTLAADGRLRVGRLRAHGLQLSEVDLVLLAEDGQLRLAPLSASLYGGRYSGKVGIDARRSPLRLTLDERLEDIQLAPFLRDFSGTEARIAGRATVHARLQGNADSTDSLRRSITGQVDLRIVDGALKGINIAQMMREASARIRGTAAPSPSGRNETDFTDLSATLRIANGQVRNDDLALRAPLVRLTGAGSASLINETIDYRLRASAVATLAGQGGDELANLRGLTIPIRISGPFAEPRFALDIESLVADSLRERAAERIDERIRERVPEGVQDTLRRGLRDLLR